MSLCLYRLEKERMLVGEDREVACGMCFVYYSQHLITSSNVGILHKTESFSMHYLRDEIRFEGKKEGSANLILL